LANQTPRVHVGFTKLLSIETDCMVKSIEKFCGVKLFKDDVAIQRIKKSMIEAYDQLLKAENEK
jgi:hypothetical protein